MEGPEVTWRFMPFFRATAAPDSGGGGTGAEGAPMLANCDPNGNLYTRAAAGSSSSNGGAGATAAPAAGAVASAALPAVAGKKNNAVTLSWSYGDTAAATPRTLVIRDGATGVGTIIWSKVIGPILAGDSKQGTETWAPGYGPGNAAINTALTAEFTAAPSGTGVQSVSLNGFTTGA